MNLLIFFAVVFATIILAIVLERIIHCPILVGFTFFSIFLVVAAVLNNITLVIVAIGLGILAFIVAFLDCTFRRSGFFRDNCCLTCDCDDNGSGRSGSNSNCNNDTNGTLTILNSNGRVVARINGNTITCNDDSDCCCNTNNLGINLISDSGNTSENNCSSCGCNRNYRMRGY